METPDKTGRNQAGRWTKGTSGNPAGRPAGARHRSTLIVEELLAGEAEAIARRLIDLALDGDATALRLALERLCPPQRERNVNVELPELADAADAAKTLAALVAGVATGELTPGEGKAIGALVGMFAKVQEIETLAERLAAVESELKGRK